MGACGSKKHELQDSQQPMVCAARSARETKDYTVSGGASRNGNSSADIVRAEAEITMAADEILIALFTSLLNGNGINTRNQAEDVRYMGPSAVLHDRAVHSLFSPRTSPPQITFIVQVPHRACALCLVEGSVCPTCLSAHTEEMFRLVGWWRLMNIGMPVGPFHGGLAAMAFGPPQHNANLGMTSTVANK
jgi:hypothetical protein